MTRQRIMVTGATGNVGRHVVSYLKDAGAAVRALTRDPGSAGLPDGVEVVGGDLSAPASLTVGLDGVEAVFLVWPFLTAEAAPRFLRVVAEHARRIVYLSSMSVRDDLRQQTDPISAFHFDIERLIERSGLEWTFVRPSGFATNTLMWASQIRADGVVRWPYGGARRSLIHERDIAAVAARALTGDGHAGKKYIVTGPDALTQVEQVRTIGETIGRRLRYEESSPKAARQRLLTAWGVPRVVAPLLPARSSVRRMADGALEAWAKLVDEPEPVTHTVREVTGERARTFREWTIDHAGDFG
jgi:uncharacterized protein YbjT (DUF2867 family)